MGRLKETVLEKSIKQVLISQDPRIRNFTISLSNRHLSPQDYEKKIKKEVGEVEGFEVYHVQSNPAYPDQYDFHIRRK